LLAAIPDWIPGIRQGFTPAGFGNWFATHVTLRASISARTACGRRALLGWRSMVAAIVRSGPGIQLKATPALLELARTWMQAAIASDPPPICVNDYSPTDHILQGRADQTGTSCAWPTDQTVGPAALPREWGLLIVFNDEVG
jgi:hypothetical protein